jgi:hypothetical protein
MTTMMTPFHLTRSPMSLQTTTMAKIPCLAR